MAVGHEVQQLAAKYGNLANEFNNVLQEVSTAGGYLNAASKEFITDPFDSKKREKGKGDFQNEVFLLTVQG